MDRIIKCLFFIVALCLVTWIINNEFDFRRETVSHINALHERIGGNVNKPILIPNYLHQGILAALPNQSAYVPFIYKDEEAVKGYYEMREWDNNVRDYYDFGKIFKQGG